MPFLQQALHILFHRESPASASEVLKTLLALWFELMSGSHFFGEVDCGFYVEYLCQSEEQTEVKRFQSPLLLWLLESSPTQVVLLLVVGLILLGVEDHGSTFADF